MKKFLICLSLLFSLLFIGNVKALNENYYGITVNDNMINNIWDQLEGKKQSEWPNTNVYDNVHIYHRTDYPFLAISKKRNNNNLIYLSFIHALNSPGYNTDTRMLDNDAYPYGAFYVYDYWNPESNGYGLYSFITVIYNVNTKTIQSYKVSNGPRLSGLIWKEYNSNSKYQFEPSITNFDISANNNSITKTFDYDFNPQPNVFNFHLNGGIARHNVDIFNLLFDGTRDFSVELYPNEIEDFFTNLKVEKATMIFEGWYYDFNFNNIFNITDNITSDIDLYAKFRYEKVDDFLNNTNFTEYTFDTLYNYAIITKGNNSGDIYLGINSNRYDITVYEYIENLSNYDNERGFCLVPIYSKNGTYYYLLDTTKTLNTEVLVLPKSTFENNDYKFLLTDNAYVTYTNNLEETIIYNSNGNQINTNLEETYQRFQDSMISEENDLLTIFKNLTGLKDNNIFNNINSLWNKFKATPIYNFLMILIVGSLIILIIKAAKRK